LAKRRFKSPGEKSTVSPAGETAFSFLNAVNDVSNPNIGALGKELVKIQQ
jgi:hypothetical protein